MGTTIGVPGMCPRTISHKRSENHRLKPQLQCWVEVSSAQLTNWGCCWLLFHRVVLIMVGLDTHDFRCSLPFNLVVIQKKGFMDVNLRPWRRHLRHHKRNLNLDANNLAVRCWSANFTSGIHSLFHGGSPRTLSVPNIHDLHHPACSLVWPDESSGG